MSIGIQPAPTGHLHVVHRAASDVRVAYIHDPIDGHYLRSRSGLLLKHRPRTAPVQQRILAWMRDRIDPSIPRRWYQLVLGHDSHVALWAELFVQHYHTTGRDPFTGEQGWLENVGRVSSGKVTTAFRDFVSAQLVTDSTVIGDFKYHEVGTDATAEANSQTALIVTTGIARVAGTQTNPTAPTYQSVATITADTSETWQEHGLFSASSGATLMDRSVISPTVAVVNLDTVTFTYVLTLNAEA